jgi:hypothetical protein
MESIVTSFVVWKPRMTDHVGKGLDARSLIKRNLVERGVKERCLIDRGDTETSLTMMSLGIASTT